MPKQMSKARETFIKRAESALKRPLAPEEQKMVLGFDEEVVRSTGESFTDQEIAEMVDDTSADSRTVQLLEQLARKPSSLPAMRQELLNFLGPKAQKLVGTFDFVSELDHFGRWLLGVLRAEPLPPSIRALNFGLFEGKSGCQLYVTGANRYSKQDSDWACANDWWPEDRYAPVEGLSQLCGRLNKTETQSWVVAQAIVIVLIKSFFEKHAGELERVFGKRKVFVASGFDGGDLYAIKTGFSPGV
jgi:hypothetical protein